MLRKSLALMLALLTLFSLASCASEPQTPTETTKKKHPVASVDSRDDATDKTPEIDDSKANYWVDLILEGQPQFTVVSESAEYDEIAELLVNTLRKNTGVSFPLKKAGEQRNVSGKKISVGRKIESIPDLPGKLSYLGNLSLDRIERSRTIFLLGQSQTSVRRTVERFASGVLTKYVVKDENGRVIECKAPDIRLFFFDNNEKLYAKNGATLLGTDLSEFVIVVPEKMNAAEFYMLKYLTDEIGVNTGCVIKSVNDKKTKAAHEIVLGQTIRPESQALYASLGEGHYALKSVDGSLYVAYDNYLVMADARGAINSLCLNSNEETVNLSERPNYDAHGMKKADDDFIRVMTSNIVCAADADGIATYEKGYGITWQNRVGLQGVMMMDYLPDFVGLQEMQEGTTNGIPALMHTELLKTVSGEYSIVEYPELTPMEYWNPILYRHTKWTLVEQEVSEQFDNGMHRWQWARFQKIDDSTVECIVMNLHYPTGKFPDKQREAAQIVNDQLDTIKEIHPNVPIFVTGDFNAAVGTQTFQTTFEDTGLVTANDGSGAIDHVVYDPNLVALQEEMFIDNGLIYMTSDHRPFFADVAIVS